MSLLKRTAKAFVGVVIFLTIVGVVLSAVTRSNFFGFLWREYSFQRSFISVSQARDCWGSARFNAVQFKQGEGRASMVADLIESKILLGSPYEKVKEVLGQPDGDYYGSDHIMTYKIVSSSTSEGEIVDYYSLIVMPSKDSRVDGLKIWKSR